MTKPDIYPDYDSDRIETFLDSRKGRGIRATDHLCFGQMIMLQSQERTIRQGHPYFERQAPQ